MCLWVAATTSHLAHRPAASTAATPLPPAGNYSPVLVTQLEAKKHGYSDVVYLDAKTDTYLEEVSSCNIFVVKGKTIKTPPLSGTILPGVTRKSVIELARSRGYTVEEVPTSVHEAMEADEIFTTGERVGWLLLLMMMVSTARWTMALCD